MPSIIKIPEIRQLIVSEARPIQHDSMISQQEILDFEKEGYLVMRGLLDPSMDLEPLRKSYERLLDALAYIFMEEANPSAISTYHNLSFPERFATLLGVSGGSILDHIDPVLNIFSPHYCRRTDLPSAQIPEIFDLIRHERILDVVEGLIGSEICVSPIYHSNLKIPQQYIQLAQKVAKISHRKDPSLSNWHDLHVGQTSWHSDAYAGLCDSHESQTVTVWIPLTEANEENSCLLVIPGSHKVGVMYSSLSEELRNQSFALPAKPGDVIFFHNKLIHGAGPNKSHDKIRLAFNFRYLPGGQTTGRPYLPSFVARSRLAPHTELRNPYLWSTMWQRALDNLVKYELPVPQNLISRKEAESITKRWQKMTPDERGWLRLSLFPFHRRVFLKLRMFIRRTWAWCRRTLSPLRRLVSGK